MSMVMYVSVYFSIRGIYFFFTDENNPIEGLMVVGYMAYYSAFLLMLYLFAIWIQWENLSKKFLVISSIPFTCMLVFTLYGTYVGIPW